jgi:small subunit ribosomal protein S29
VYGVGFVTVTGSFGRSFGSDMLGAAYYLWQVQCRMGLLYKFSDLTTFSKSRRPHFSVEMPLGPLNLSFIQHDENTTPIPPEMASSSCWKCLTRPSMPLRYLNSYNIPSRHSVLVSSFSTSITRQVDQRTINAAKSKARIAAGMASGKKMGSIKSFKLKKKVVVKTGRPPAPGERKAIRKRIVLSNSNALEVPTMVDMTAELDTAQVGTVIGLPGPLVDQLRAVEAFKTTQGWGLFRRPAMLIRGQSIEIAKMIQEAQDAKKTSITIIDGERGAGKSIMLLQGMAIAFQNGWIVLNIPEGKVLLPSQETTSLIS